MDGFEIGKCVVCGYPSRGYICTSHVKKYTVNTNFGFIHLKPRCKVSDFQKNLYDIIKKLYHLETYQEVIFPWCFTGKSYYRFDVVVPKLNLIVEMDGQGHFKFIPFFHKTKKGFEESQLRDIIKEKLAQEYGYKVIRFNYKQRISLNFIQDIFIFNGVVNNHVSRDVACTVIGGSICRR